MKKSIACLVILLAILISGCTGESDTNIPAGKSPDKSACKIDSDCQTPVSYLMRSICPYGSKCIDNKCEVVCAMYTHAQDPNISESYPAKCEKDTDCDCKSYLPKDLDSCSCLDARCYAVVRENTT